MWLQLSRRWGHRCPKRQPVQSWRIVMAMVVAGTGCFLGPTVASGQNQTRTRVDVYADEWITVISPGASGSVAATDQVRVDAGYAVDILSGATHVLTADAVSSATHFDEIRHEAHLATSILVTPRWNVGAGYTMSFEPDYVTHAVTLSTGSEILDRMAQWSVAYSASFETLGQVTDERFSEAGHGHALTLGWTHILGKTTTITGTLSGSLSFCGSLIGCHSNPYRFVPIVTSADPLSGIAFTLRERHPDDRFRGAAGVRVAQHLGSGFAISGGYRFYGDSWEVIGHTAETALSFGAWDERLVLRLEGRGSLQGAASFFRDDYRTVQGSGVGPTYRSADRELSELMTGQLGLSVAVHFPAVGPFVRLGVNARIARAAYRYEDVSEFPQRHAWIAGGGVDAEF